MKRLFNVYDKVVPLLKEYPSTRDSDGVLIATLDENLNPLVKNMTYGEVMRNRSKLGLPTCESVRRARQKAFNENPELRPSDKVQQNREIMEQEYLDFARSKV